MENSATNNEKLFNKRMGGEPICNARNAEAPMCPRSDTTVLAVTMVQTNMFATIAEKNSPSVVSKVEP